MYEYKYVNFNHTIGVLQAKMDPYPEIIDMHAKEGWRLVQILAVKFSVHGIPTEFQIIFERKLEV